MSWLGKSPLRQSFSRTNSQPIRTNDCDPQACYDSFCKHWQQIYDIILKVEVIDFIQSPNTMKKTQFSFPYLSTLQPKKPPTHDDVLGVVSHLDHMVTLLLVELQNCNKVTLPGLHPPPAPCLEFLLSENLLDKLYEWSSSTGRLCNSNPLLTKSHRTKNEFHFQIFECRSFGAIKAVRTARQSFSTSTVGAWTILKTIAENFSIQSGRDISTRHWETTCDTFESTVRCSYAKRSFVGFIFLFVFATGTRRHKVNYFFLFNFTKILTNCLTLIRFSFLIFSLLIPYVHRDGSIGKDCLIAGLLVWEC